MMKRHLAFVLLIAAVQLGCAASRHQVKLIVEGGPAIAHTPESGGQPIQVPEAELRESFREAARDVVPQADPLAAAELTFGLTEMSGSYFYLGRSGRLVPDRLGAGLEEVEDAAERVTRGYLEWCGGTKLGGGDCLRLLRHSPVLTPHGRYVVTLVMAMVRSFEPMMESLEWMADPGAVAVTLGSAAAMYLTLWLIPEPLSKIIATGLTVFLIGYLGLDLFFSIGDGWKALTEAADKAQHFGELRLAARDFGQVLGPQAGQVFLMLVSHSLGKGLTAKAKSLPRFKEAAAQGEKVLRVRLGAAGGVRTVAVGAGVLTISIATPALAMTKATGAGGGSRIRVVQAAEWDPPEGGPGKWTKERKEAMSDEARRYQSQISGAPQGWVYKVGEVSFDGYKNGILLDAKDRYAQFLEKGPPTGPKRFFGGFGEMKIRALNQLSVARGTRVRWHFSEKEVADYVRALFRDDAALKAIEIVHTPKAP